MNEEATEITLLVIEALDKVGIRYLIGGSLASSLYGMARSTQDSDLLADVQLGHATSLESALKEQFYITEEEILNAIRFRSSFNVIHFETSFKVDLFIPKYRAFDELQFSNRYLAVVASNPDRMAYVASAEDTILAKLEWYRSGGEISERQWLDVLGVIKVQGPKLNRDYLKEKAVDLGVTDLLERALQISPE